MNVLRRSFVMILILGITAVGAASQTRRGTQQYQRQVIHQLESHLDTFRNSLNASFNRNGTDNSRQQENTNLIMSNLTDAVTRMHERVDRREATANDAQEILNNAAAIDRFLQRRPQDWRTQQSWTNVRSDLDRLASIYGVSWPTTGRNYPGDSRYPGDPNYP